MRGDGNGTGGGTGEGSRVRDISVIREGSESSQVVRQEQAPGGKRESEHHLGVVVSENVFLQYEMKEK